MVKYIHIQMRPEIYESLVKPHIDPAEGFVSGTDVIVEALRFWNAAKRKEMVK